MSSNNSKPGSTRARTIFKKRNGAYVVGRDEDGVTHVDPLHIVKGNSLNNFVAEPDRARDVLEAAIADIATIAAVAVIGDAAVITYMTAIADGVDACGLLDLRNAAVGYGWSAQRVQMDALER